MTLSKFHHELRFGLGFTGSLYYWAFENQDDTSGAVHKIAFSDAAPGSGDWLVGDLVFDDATADRVGWRCTVAGSPGTWVEIGASGSGDYIQVNGIDVTDGGNFVDTDAGAPVQGEIDIAFQRSSTSPDNISAYLSRLSLVGNVPNGLHRGWGLWTTGAVGTPAPTQIGLHRQTGGVASFSYPTFSTASYRETVHRWRNQCPVAAGANNTHERSWATTADPGHPFWRGNSAGQGGFFLAILGLSLGCDSGGRCFFGLFGEAASAGVATTNDPSTYLNILGVAADDTDTNLQFMHNDGSGTATKVDLGVAKTVTTSVYDIFIFCEANGSEVFYRLVRRDSVVADIASSVTTDIPGNTVNMGCQIHMGYPGGSVPITYYEIRMLYGEWGVGNGVTDYGLVV